MNDKMTREKAIAGTPEDKEKYLKNLTLLHYSFNATATTVRRALAPSKGVVLLSGPTGVGKSTFAELQLQYFLKKYAAEIQEDPSFIPAVLVTLKATDTPNEFNFCLFYQQACAELMTPCPVDNAFRRSSSIDITNSARRIFERALVNRKVRHLIIDEAIHLAHSGINSVFCGDLWKSIGDTAGLNVLLVGAYGSEALADATGQLVRRTVVKEFQRYHDNKDDFLRYAQVVKDFTKRVPLPTPVDLREHMPLLFVATCGLFGWTADIIIRAVILCAMDGGKWDDGYLFCEMPSQAQHDKVAEETTLGEIGIKRYLQSRYPQNYTSEREVSAKIEGRKKSVGSESQSSRRKHS
ncbi:ATP-binding protein [Paraburkholderia terrae]|uniref:ATP-binding protein n=1 Tax=Paraburkholderia terrae TaxID=311230 RepID=UPI00296B1C62|nr:AAA family ATPase [Paraburkholderia terrae]MDW3663260.1 AAA family ATPase [Paraburkholderia terrae]